MWKVQKTGDSQLRNPHSLKMLAVEALSSIFSTTEAIPRFGIGMNWGFCGEKFVDSCKPGQTHARVQSRSHRECFNVLRPCKITSFKTLNPKPFRTQPCILPEEAERAAAAAVAPSEQAICTTTEILELRGSRVGKYSGFGFRGLGV